MGERLKDGRVITGAPTDVKGAIPFVGKEGRKTLKDQMYQDFLLSKSKGEVDLQYRFDTWCNRALGVLKTIRKRDLLAEKDMGKLGISEFEALEDMRLRMIEAITTFDYADSHYDMYGIQHLDMSLADAEFSVQQTDKVIPGKDKILTPTHRPGVVKTKPDPKGKVIIGKLGGDGPPKEGHA